MEVGRYEPILEETPDTTPWETWRNRDARPSAKVEGLRSSVGGPAEGEGDDVWESASSSSF